MDICRYAVIATIDTINLTMPSIPFIQVALSYLKILYISYNNLVHAKLI